MTTEVRYRVTRDEYLRFNRTASVSCLRCQMFQIVVPAVWVALIGGIVIPDSWPGLLLVAAAVSVVALFIIAWLVPRAWTRRHDGMDAWIGRDVVLSIEDDGLHVTRGASTECCGWQDLGTITLHPDFIEILQGPIRPYAMVPRRAFGDGQAENDFISLLQRRRQEHAGW